MTTPDQLQYLIPEHFDATVYPTFQYNETGDLENLAQVWVDNSKVFELSQWLSENCTRLDWKVIGGGSPPF